MSPISVDVEGGKQFALPKVGLHRAQLVDVVDLGVQPRGQYEPKRTILFTFQLEERIQDEDSDFNGQRFLAHQRFTASMNARANMRKFISDWIGKALNDEQAQKVAGDLEKLIGKQSLVNIQHDEKGDRTYVRIASVMPPEDKTPWDIEGFVRKQDREEKPATSTETAKPVAAKPAAKDESVEDILDF